MSAEVIPFPQTPEAPQPDLRTALGEVLREFPKVAIATDDMYEHIRWDLDRPFVNILNACPDLANRTLVLNGVSKAYSMTGWRIGWIVVPEAAVDEIEKLAAEKQIAPAQLALAWVLAQGEDIATIPGTRRIERLEQNVAAAAIALSDGDVARLSKLADLGVVGARY